MVGGKPRREVWSQDVIAVMTVMTANFGKPIKTNNYLKRVVMFLFYSEPQPLELQWGWWYIVVLTGIDFLMLYHKSNYQHLILGYEDVSLWKYSRLVLAGMHHQSKLDPRKTSASLCWMGREFLASVKNIWKDLTNINSEQWAVG